MKKLRDIPNGVFPKEKNFLTRDILGYYKKGKVYAELSTGEGMDHKPIYGVTVSVVTYKIDTKLSKCCFSMQEAIDYINSLPDEVTNA